VRVSRQADKTKVIYAQCKMGMAHQNTLQSWGYATRRRLLFSVGDLLDHPQRWMVTPASCEKERRKGGIRVV
jgi:hypothetical protein